MPLNSSAFIKRYVQSQRFVSVIRYRFWKNVESGAHLSDQLFSLQQKRDRIMDTIFWICIYVYNFF